MRSSHTAEILAKNELQGMQSMPDPSSVSPSSFVFRPELAGECPHGIIPESSIDAIAESSIMVQLRSIVRRCAAISPPEVHSGKHISQETLGSTELSWQNKRLLWSRHCQVIKSFTFPERVVHALWSWMSPSGFRHPLHSAAPPNAWPCRSNKTSARATGVASDNAFSHQQRVFQDSLAGHAAADNANFPECGMSRIQLGAAGRALVVVLESYIWIHFPQSGEDYAVAKSFKLERAFPSNGGVFLQRRLEMEDARMPRSEKSSNISKRADDFARLPTFFFLPGHLEEIVPVSFPNYSTENLLPDADESVVFVSQPSTTKAPDSAGIPLIISVAPRSGRVKVYTYAIGVYNGRRPLRPPGEKYTQTSEPQSADRIRDEQASSEKAIGKGHPSMESRRKSSRVSIQSVSNVTSFGSTKRDTSGAVKKATRRRSSRFPSAAEVGNMSRIDESFIQKREPTQSFAGSLRPSVLPPDSARRHGEAVQAEEFGQMVDSLARSVASIPQDKGTGFDHTTEEDIGASLMLTTRRSSEAVSSSRQRRISQMMGTPYVPTSSRIPSHQARSNTKRRMSRGSDPDFEPSSFHSTNLDGVSMLTTAEERYSNAQHQSDATSLPSGTKSIENLMRLSRTHFSLIDVIDIGAVDSASKINAFTLHDSETNSATVCIQDLRHLHLRRFSFTKNSSRVTVIIRSRTESISAIPFRTCARSSKQALILRPDGVSLRLFDGYCLKGPTLNLILSLSGSAPVFTVVIGQEDHTAQAMKALREIPGSSNAVEVTLATGIKLNVKLPSLGASNNTVERILDACYDGWSLRVEFAKWRSASDNDWATLERAIFQSSVNNDRTFAAPPAREKQLDPFQLLPVRQAETNIPSEGVIAGVQPAVLPFIENLLAILHATAQDLLLDIRDLRGDYAAVVQLLVRTSEAANALAMLEYWSLHEPELATNALQDMKLNDGRESSHSEPSPVDALKVLSQATHDRDSMEALHSLAPGLSLAQTQIAMPLAFRLLKILCAKPKTLPEGTATQGCQDLHFSVTAVTEMVHQGITPAEISRLPSIISTRLRLILRKCAEAGVSGLSPEAYRLMDRHDLAWIDHEQQEMCFPCEALRSMPAGSRLDGLSAMLFSKDYRLQDVVEMLQTHKVTVLRAPCMSNKTDEEAREAGLALLHNVAERIKASPVGRGMLLLLTRPFDPTQKWTTPRLNRRILLRPAQPYHHPEPRPDSAEMDWPEFHNGAASALEMTVSDVKIDSIWYFSQSSGERNPRHAGLLLGLGLAGRFASIGKVHTYRYLGDRHNLTSIGLLLGLSATFAGRGDPDIRALLACHIKAFLPPHSANLAHSTLVQSAALLGTGLLFLGTNVSHIAEALCDQIGAQEIETTDAQMFSRGAYALSAGIGAGLVLLGRARKGPMSTMREKRLLAILEHHILERTPALFEEPNSDLLWKVDRRITAPVAALAHALIFLKSNDDKACAKVALPSCPSELDQVRPDALLLFSISRNLIMWDAMEPREDWPASTLPAFLRKKATSMRVDLQLARLHILSGTYFAMALKYAGSNNQNAKAELLRYQASIAEQSKHIDKRSYDGRILCSALRSSGDIITVSLSIVLAGSGDVDVLRLLRIAHAQSPASEPYGSHMATHMALGMLFLAGGRCTLATSDAAVAALLIAFYPRFPTRASDNRAHLQAYRHLWMLAVEPRLVIAQDVQSGEMVYVPVTISHTNTSAGGREDSETLAVTPLQLPDLSRVRAVKVSSPRYFETVSRFYNGEEKRISAKGSVHARTLYVQRRTGYLSYIADPKGHKSDLLKATARDRVEIGIDNARVLSVSGHLAGRRLAQPELIRLLDDLIGVESLDAPKKTRIETTLLASTLSDCFDRDALCLAPLCISLLNCRDLTMEPRKLRDRLSVLEWAALGAPDATKDAMLSWPLIVSTRRVLQRLARRQLEGSDVRTVLQSHLSRRVRIAEAAGGRVGLVRKVANVLAILAPALTTAQLQRLGELMRQTHLEYQGTAALSSEERPIIEATLNLGCTVGRQISGQHIDRELMRVML